MTVTPSSLLLRLTDPVILDSFYAHLTTNLSEILLALLSESLQNLIPLYHLHCYHSGGATPHLLLGLSGLLIPLASTSTHPSLHTNTHTYMCTRTHASACTHMCPVYSQQDSQRDALKMEVRLLHISTQNLLNDPPLCFEENSKSIQESIKLLSPF